MTVTPVFAPLALINLGLPGHLITSLRLPWDDLGRVAANILWKRRHGEWEVV